MYVLYVYLGTLETWLTQIWLLFFCVHLTVSKKTIEHCLSFLKSQVHNISFTSEPYSVSHPQSRACLPQARSSCGRTLLVKVWLPLGVPERMVGLRLLRAFEGLSAWVHFITIKSQCLRPEGRAHSWVFWLFSFPSLFETGLPVALLGPELAEWMRMALNPSHAL